MAKLSPQGPFRALDGNGAPLSEGRLYTYEAGTTTPKDTFTTSAADVANSNPVELDSNGYADVWLGSGSYKLVLTDKNDVIQYTLDNVLGDTTAGFGGSTIETDSNLNITSVFDKSAVICTDTLTLSLLDAESAGDGFYFIVKNAGAGVVTIDPDLTETIDGAETLTLQQSESAIIRCQGESWNSLFLNVIQDGSITTDKIADQAVTPEKLADGIILTKADQPEAEAGADNEKYMTALRTQQSINVNAIDEVLAEGTFSNDAGLDLPNVFDASRYSQYDLEVGSIQTDSDAILYCDLSVDGSTYLASGYRGGATESAGVATDTNSFRLSRQSHDTSGIFAANYVFHVNPDNTVVVTGSYTGINTSLTEFVGTVVARNTSTNSPTGIRFRPASSTFVTGTYRLTGKRKMQ